jgi:hypothetical protein
MPRGSKSCDSHFSAVFLGRAQVKSAERERVEFARDNVIDEQLNHSLFETRNENEESSLRPRD